MPALPWLVRAPASVYLFVRACLCTQLASTLCGLTLRGGCMDARSFDTCRRYRATLWSLIVLSIVGSAFVLIYTFIWSASDADYPKVCCVHARQCLSVALVCRLGAETS